MHGRLFSSLLLLPAMLASANTPDCEIQSQTHRVALRELYNSEGFSSCPPADTWLSNLRAQGVTAEKLVP